MFAFDATTSLPKTGDAANITAYVGKDYGAATVLGDTSATEIDATNAKGYYLFDLTQAETNADTLLFSAKSSTSNIVVIGSPATVFTDPANFTTFLIDLSGRIDIGKALGTAVTLDSNNALNVSTKYLAGTSLTARDIGASVLLSTGTGTGQLDFTSGIVKANATQWLGGTIPAVNVTGVPLVDAKYLLGTVFATPATAGVLDANAKNWGNSVVTGMPMPTFTQPTGFLAATFPSGTIANTTNLTAGTIATVTNQLTAAAIATGVWQDATAGDFTVASSIGKAMYIANVAPGAAGGHFIAGANAATSITTALTANIIGNVTGNLSGSVGSVTGLTAANLDATISSRMATYTQPTGFLAATFPATVASTTNITAGTITTVTNLTNAPTSGDFTATMKTSLTTAATAATPTVALNTAQGAVTFSSLTVTGQTWLEAGLKITQSTLNGDGIEIIGNGNGSGIDCSSTGPGRAANFYVDGTSGSDSAVYIAGENGASGLYCNSDGGNAVYLSAGGVGSRALLMSNSDSFAMQIDIAVIDALTIGGETLPAIILDAAQSAHNTAGTIGYDIGASAKAGDAMTLTSGERTAIGTAVWAAATRTLTAGTNITITALSGITSLGNWLRAMARKDAPDATALTEINASTNSIVGHFDSTTDAQEAIADNTGAGLFGPSSVTLTFHDAAAAMVPLVDFTILGQGSARANNSGIAAFGLANGTYTVVSRPTASTLFPNSTLTVSGTTAITITGTAITYTTPSAGETTCYLTTYDGKGVATAGILVTFRLIGTATSGGHAYPRASFDIASGSGGLLQVQLVTGQAYQARLDKGDWIDFTPVGANFELQDLFGFKDQTP